MAITNREIITSQVKRINEKTGMDFSLSETDSDGNCFLQSNNNVLYENMIVYRSEEQMIEYLAGMEDAIDYFTKRKE